MKKRGTLWLMISLFAMALIGFIFKHVDQEDPLELTEVDVTSSNMGILEEELTFSTIMEQTSAVVVGEVTGIETLNDKRPVFLVDILESIVGETDADQVLVYIDVESIELNETYVFFIDSFDSSLYDKLFYTQHPEFVVKVDESHELWRLEDAFEKTYVRPFTDQTMNTLDGLKKNIKANVKVHALQEEERIEDAFNDPQHLLDESDVVAEVKVVDVLDDRGIATVSYELVKQHKGTLDDNYLHLPTNKVEKGDSYMIFLQERDGELSLTTRNNSVLNLKDENAHDFLLSIDKMLEMK